MLQKFNDLNFDLCRLKANLLVHGYVLGLGNLVDSVKIFLKIVKVPKKKKLQFSQIYIKFGINIAKMVKKNHEIFDRFHDFLIALTISIFTNI